MSGILPSEIVTALLHDWRVLACRCAQLPGIGVKRECPSCGPAGQERAQVVGAVIRQLQRKERGEP
jgi:hypothetical protein